MNYRLCLLLLVVVLSGCGSPISTTAPPPPGFSTATLKPDSRPRGRIKSVNEPGQYAIVDFGLGIIPPLQSDLNVYRDGRVTGVLKLTGPARNNIVAADIVSGEAKAGDVAILENSTRGEEENPGDAAD